MSRGRTTNDQVPVSGEEENSGPRDSPTHHVLHGTLSDGLHFPTRDQLQEAADFIFAKILQRRSGLQVMSLRVPRDRRCAADLRFPSDGPSLAPTPRTYQLADILNPWV